MMIIRPVNADDLDQLVDLAESATSGMTTLPADRRTLARRIARSEDSFFNAGPVTGEEYYLLVLEDTEKGLIAGTSAIFAGVGRSKPFYNYKLLHLTQLSHEPPKKVDTKVLTLVNDYAGACELATLYLRPEYRKNGNGALLSKARFFIMAQYPERFPETIMAELRGWVDENGDSPFWDAVGRHFFDMSLQEADETNGKGNSQFIADLMPKYPIYVSLLPQDAQDVIGKPHEETKAAMELLMSEGFRSRGGVDIFDAGPCVESQLEDIRAVRNCRPATVRYGNPSGEDRVLIGNTQLAGFRAMLAEGDKDGDAVTISAENATALGAPDGGTLHIIVREDQ